MEIVILGLLAFVGYKFLRTTTSAGREAVRAYVYLEALNKGVDPHEAETIADAMVSDPSSDVTKRATDVARRGYQRFHGGKQLAVIGYAYRHGLRSNMPFWYTAFARAVPPTAQVETSYGMLRQEQVLPENVHVFETMMSGEGYKPFCEAFCNEVNRLAGEQRLELNEGGTLDGGDLYRLYQQGEDAWVAAAMYCHEHGINRQVFTTYESYRTAFASELLRLAGDPADLGDILSKVDNTRLHTNFNDGTHPRLAAVGFYEFVSQPQRT